LTDLEGLANILLNKGVSPKKVKSRLTNEVLTYKKTSRKNAEKFSKAVIREVILSRKATKNRVLKKLFNFYGSQVAMGEMGVGSRGKGDIYVHNLIARLATIGVQPPLLGPVSLDDAGAVYRKGVVVTVAVDGTHSRLSNFPFLAGFHVTRACLRDVYVKGAEPVALFDDLHLADDGDISTIFDFIAGANTVSSLMKIPLVSGSTLRIGGDMVLGNRLVSCVGAVGLAESPRNLTAKRNIRAGDVILMTEGAGGGTIATTAIYSGKFPVVLETLNLKFLEVCHHLIESGLTSKIHAMTDVTNGGIRGDANTICKEAGIGIAIDRERVECLVNKKVLQMLKELSVDPLGVSIDSLMIFTAEKAAEEICKEVKKLDVNIDKIGRVHTKPCKAYVFYRGLQSELSPLFRESAYTEIKKVVGEETPSDIRNLQKKIDKAFREAVKKRNFFTKYIQRDR
jgi:hydrogenase expression/formation protein